NALAQKIQSKNVTDVQVDHLKCGMNNSSRETHAGDTVNLIEQAYHSRANYLHLLVVFDLKEVNAFVSEYRHIQLIIQLGKDTNIAVFTVGSAGSDSLLFKLGYFNETETATLQEKAVGDLCSRFIDADGNICNEAVNNRTVGIELADLKNKEQSVLVAGGDHKVNSITAALNGEYANILVTDQFTAKKLVTNDERKF